MKTLISLSPLCVIMSYPLDSLLLLPAVDRCAVSFATSALWYLQRGQIDKAIERCDYVIDQVLPSYDKKDIMDYITSLFRLDVY